MDPIAWPRGAVAAEIFWTGATLPSGQARNVDEALQLRVVDFGGAVGRVPARRGVIWIGQLLSACHEGEDVAAPGDLGCGIEAGLLNRW